MRPQIQQRPQLQERRLLHQDPRHRPRRDPFQGQKDRQEERQQGILTHSGGPGREEAQVFQGRPNETGRVRLEDELRRRMHRVRDRHRRPRAQADHPQLCQGDSSKTPRGQQDGRQSRDSHRGLHQGPGPGQQRDEQRTRAHIRRREPAIPQGQRGVAKGRGRRTRLRRGAGAGERRRGQEPAALRRPRPETPALHPVEGGHEPRGQARGWRSGEARHLPPRLLRS